MVQPTVEELEQVEGEKALLWVRAQNAKTIHTFENNPEFDKIQQDVLKILESKEKIPHVSKIGNYYYNFWRDETHVRGLWRRTTLDEFLKESPQWEVIMDVDALAKEEDMNWVFKGAQRLMPDGNLCMVSLSIGGTDANVKREFDIHKKQFVENGFTIPEAKSRASWIDKDHLLIGTDLGEGSVTDSGYPRQIRLLTRGQEIEKAPVIFEGKQSDVSVTGYTHVRPEGSTLYITRSMSFFEGEHYVATLNDNYEPTLTTIPIPHTSDILDTFNHHAIILLKEDCQLSNNSYSKGSLIAVDLDSLNTNLKSHLVFEPKDKMAIDSVSATLSKLYVTVNHNVSSEVYQLTPTVDGYDMAQIPLPKNGAAGITTASDFSDEVMFSYENFLTPSTLFRYHPKDGQLEPIKHAPSHFDASDMVVEQNHAISKDGTKVPYFIVHKKELMLDGQNPTLLYGYGGFEVSLTPGYSGTLGKTWLESGGVYVLSNIRGGGEFGPDWHQAALKENRQRAYDDFEAIAKDLIERKVTTPEHLGIQGGSNGGLLMGVAFTQHPELYNAVVCQVPLLDMLNYHKLSAGASWVGEYGDPDQPAMRKVIEKYSPLQNVFKEKEYPEVFFMTSTKDDRVHPSHARKMVAKMQEQGHKVFYYETIEGGHGAAANLKQSAFNKAMTTVYLKQKLCKPREINDKEVEVDGTLIQPPSPLLTGFDSSHYKTHKEDIEPALEDQLKLKKAI